MQYKKPTPRDLRKINRSQILRKIYFDGPISRLEVSQQIGISPATVTNIVGALINKGILAEAGTKQSVGGRPSTYLEINPDYGKFIGVEVGETFIETELFDIRLNSIEKLYYPLTSEQVTPDQIVIQIANSIKQIIQKLNLAPEQIIGTGIGFPGLVDPVKGVSIFTPNWGWHDVSITDQLRGELSIPMFIDNGAKAMAIAEMMFGAGKNINNMAVLLVGTGVGSGIIANRKIFRGSANNAGEFGHTSLNIHGPQCRCGSNGCLEVYTGANGIINRYLQSSQPRQQSNLIDQISFIEHILKKYDDGDPVAIATIDETISYLGVGIANLINSFNPEVILLGGWLGLLLGNKHLDRIEQIVSKFALQQSLAKTTIRLCQLGQGSVAIGAGTLVLEHFFETAGESEELMVGGRAIT
jgi:glucokinase-like ROK family protein